MKNLATFLGLLLVGNIVVSSTSDIKVSPEITEDIAVKADYILMKNKHKLIFGKPNDTITKNK